MSELKTRTAYSIAMEEEDLESSGTTLVYLKSEADKVIAEKDAEIAELQKQVYDYAQGLYVMQARAEM